MTWDYKRFGEVTDPIRQSALGAFASQDGCGRRYRYQRDDEADGTSRTRDHAAWRPTVGTAVHAVIERALVRPEIAAAVLEGKLPSHARIDTALAEEMERAAAGLPISWGDASSAIELASARWMVLGALRVVAEYASAVVAVEAPFAAELEGYHLTGTIDLVFTPKDAPGTTALLDWKTGARAMPKVVLDHGYQNAIYAHALERGVLWPGEERERVIGQHPSAIYVVHLRAFSAFERTRAVLDELRGGGGITSSDLVEVMVRRGWPLSAHSIAATLKSLQAQGLARAEKRGRSNAWTATPSEHEPSMRELVYRAHRGADDRARLVVSLKTVVGTVRMGRFAERFGEQCDRCVYRERCLGEGYVAETKEKRAADRAIDEAGFDDLLPAA